MKQYLNNPDSYIASQRLKQLVDSFGSEAVQNELYFGWGSSDSLGIHIDNLLQTYPTSVVLEIADTIFKKVG